MKMNIEIDGIEYKVSRSLDGGMFRISTEIPGEEHPLLYMTPDEFDAWLASGDEIKALAWSRVSAKDVKDVLESFGDG